MWVKWIRCRLQPDQRAAFSERQRQWDRCAGIEGFRGQLGGWRREAPAAHPEACLLAFWEDEERYRRFMEREHDQVLEHAGQAWEAIEVRFAEIRLEVAGSHRDPLEALSLCRVLRCLEHDLVEASLDERLENQRRIWATGLPSHQGLLFGLSAWEAGRGRLLNLSLWQDALSQRLFQEQVFPDLARRGGLPDELELSTFAVDQTWTVYPVSNS